MTEEEKKRRKRIAVLTVVLPITAGILILISTHFFGKEETTAKTPEGQERARIEAAVPAETGSPAPRVRLREPATGKVFDSASLGVTPFAAVFTSTRCEAAGRYLSRAAGALGGGIGAIVVISADPEVDTPKSVRAWLAKHRIATGGPLHFLVGSESEVKGFWNAWGFNGPATECGATVPAHLVGSSKGRYINTGILDIDPSDSVEILTGTLRALDH